MAFINLEIIGQSDLGPSAKVFHETRECDQCHKIHSFEFTCCYSIETMQRVRKFEEERSFRPSGDLCYDCKMIKDNPNGYQLHLL